MRVLHALVVVLVAGGVAVAARPSHDERKSARQGNRKSDSGVVGRSPEEPLDADDHFTRHFQGATARDQTSRMDLVKSLDDIIQSPYDGPHLRSLEPLLFRNSISRLTRDSSNNRPDLFPSQQSRRPFPFDSYSGTSSGQTLFRKPPHESNSLSSPDRSTPPHRQQNSQFVGGFGSSPNLDHRQRGSFDPFESFNNFKSSPHSQASQFSFSKPSRAPSENFKNRFFNKPRNEFRHHSRIPRSTRFTETSRPQGFVDLDRHNNPSFALSTDNFHTIVSSEIERMDSLKTKSSDSRSGFIVGKPSDFPSFQSIGGFAPMDSTSANKEDNFLRTFEWPSVDIPELKVKQRPQLTANNFPSRKVTLKGTGPKEGDAEMKLDSRAFEEQQTRESKHHVTVARKGAADPDAHFSHHSRVTRQFPSFPFFDYPSEGRGRENRPHHSPRNEFEPAPRHSPPQSRPTRYQSHDPEPASPQSQRFFPSLPPTPHKRSPHRNHAFFPSATHPGARGGGPSSFQQRRPSFRSHRPHKAAQTPKFSFSPTKFKDYKPVDNSILGSGNFDVIRGGTFYDDDNPHVNHNPYDPYLENSYVLFPSGNPHAHNHVDDYFSNFRDFSEFATRRSGSVHTDDFDDGHLEPGYASELVARVSQIEYDDLMTSESNTNGTDTHLAPPLFTTEAQQSALLVQTQHGQTTNPSHVIGSPVANKKKSDKLFKPKKLKKYNFTNKKTAKSKATTKRPNNIRDVLQQQGDSSPSLSTNSEPTPLEDAFTKEEDPLIAIY